jgi:spermidine synthase
MRVMANRVDNPWLEVPLGDYESHMSSAGVEQSAALSELFDEALAHCQPESVAVIGIAGGNGLDRIDSSVTRRVVGVDINPAYLDTVRQRYGHMRGLELMCADLTERFDGCPPV